MTLFRITSPGWTPNLKTAFLVSYNRQKWKKSDVISWVWGWSKINVRLTLSGPYSYFDSPLKLVVGHQKIYNVHWNKVSLIYWHFLSTRRHHQPTNCVQSSKAVAEIINIDDKVGARGQDDPKIKILGWHFFHLICDICESVIGTKEGHQWIQNVMWNNDQRTTPREC